MPEWMEVVSAVLATVGAVLGILATWAGLNRDRPRLRVRLVWVWYEHRDGVAVRVSSRLEDAVKQQPQGQLGIDVVNRGYVAVRLAEVGVTADRFAWWRGFREPPHPRPRTAITQVDPRLPGLPFEIPVGGRVLVVAGSQLVDLAAGRRMRRVYALTEDERLVVARSVFFRALNRR